MSPDTVLSIDPGTRKCGVAIVRRGASPETLYRAVVEPVALPETIAPLLIQYKPDALLIGDATAAKKIAEVLRPRLPENFPMHFVPEAYTSVKARTRWCQENPPRTFWEWLLPGFRTPTEPCDDYAAVILAEQFLAGV